MNFGRKTMKAGVAAVAAIATLGAGGNAPAEEESWRSTSR